MNYKLMIKEEKQIKNIAKVIALHLLPGIIVTLAYVLLLKFRVLEGYPKVMLLALAGIPGILMMELGYLFYVAKKEEGTFNIFKILGLKSKLKGKQFVFFTVVLFGLAGLLIVSSKSISDFLLNNVFSFIPNWFNLMEDMSLFNRNTLIVTIIINFFIITLIYPVIEELYFRGFLLARMKWMGKYSVILNVVLFAFYHFWTPWLIVARILAFLPLFYIVYKKDSLKLAISVHCLVSDGTPTVS
jgi:hypothetical protein